MRGLCWLFPACPERALAHVRRARSESSVPVYVEFTRLRTAPAPRALIREALPGPAHPSDPPRGNPRDQGEVGHITGHDRTGSAQRPITHPATTTERAPSDAPARTRTPLASQSAGLFSFPVTSTERGKRSLVSTAAGPMNTSSSSRAGS